MPTFVPGDRVWMILNNKPDLVYLRTIYDDGCQVSWTPDGPLHWLNHKGFYAKESQIRARWLESAQARLIEAHGTLATRVVELARCRAAEEGADVDAVCAQILDGLIEWAAKYQEINILESLRSTLGAKEKTT